jgi:hypothetical protein
MIDDEGLGQLYRTAITHVAGGQPDATQARTTARKRRRNQRVAAAAGMVAVSVVLLGVLPRALEKDETIAAVPTPSSTAQPGRAMTAEPATTPAGALVTLTFPDQRLRGVAFRLESAQPTGWQLDYYLIAGRTGSKEPGRYSWYRADDPHRTWVQVGITGPGGEKVRIPDIAAPGMYRLCTEGAAQEACTPLTIT